MDTRIDPEGSMDISEDTSEGSKDTPEDTPDALEGSNITRVVIMVCIQNPMLVCKFRGSLGHAGVVHSMLVDYPTWTYLPSMDIPICDGCLGDILAKVQKLNDVRRLIHYVFREVSPDVSVYAREYYSDITLVSRYP